MLPGEACLETTKDPFEDPLSVAGPDSEPHPAPDCGAAVLSAEGMTPTGTSFDTDLILSRSENHLDLIMFRYKELWGDQGSENDVLTVNGTNVINAATSPISHTTNAMFAFDQGSDRQSDVSAPIPVFFGLPFLSAVDLFIPAASPPTGTVQVALTSRGSGPAREVSFPNYPSSNNTVSVQLNDFEQ